MYGNVKNLLVDIGKPLGCSFNKVNHPNYLLVMLWLIDAKVFARINKKKGESTQYYVSFYDTLEAIAKITLYNQEKLHKALTCSNVDDIKDKLMALSKQKLLLSAPDQRQLRKINEIKRFKDTHKSYEITSELTVTNFRLSYLAMAAYKILVLIKHKVENNKLKKIASMGDKQEIVISEKLRRGMTSRTVKEAREKNLGVLQENAEGSNNRPANEEKKEGDVPNEPLITSANGKNAEKDGLKENGDKPTN